MARPRRNRADMDAVLSDLDNEIAGVEVIPAGVSIETLVGTPQFQLTTEKYHTEEEAKRDFDILVKAGTSLTAGIVMWVIRDGWKQMGFESATAGVEAMGELSQTQAYRTVNLAIVAEKISDAAGLPGSDGIRRILEIPGVSARNADTLKKRLPQLEAAIRDADVHEPEVIVGEVVPQAVKDIIKPPKPAAPPVPPAAATPPVPPPPPSNPPVIEPDPDHVPWSANDTGPGDPYAEDYAEAAQAGTGEQYAPIPTPAAKPAAPATEFAPCPHCNGTGTIAKH
ncbi:hypothetical protein GS504_01800 [Rhodococcus hoagii]|nr:hypothetical protein [Prescottella equi]NKS72243.1 hypothetical protein [Prescottella equi]